MRKALSTSDKKLFDLSRDYIYTKNLELQIKEDAPDEAKKAFEKYMNKEKQKYVADNHQYKDKSSNI